MVPNQFTKTLQEALCKRFAKEVSIHNFRSVGGGCINQAGILHTTMGNYFVKWNNRHAYPGMFEAEEKGLQLLRQTNEIPIPQPLFCGESGGFAYLLMEAIDCGQATSNFWQSFGVSLAKLHKHFGTCFGLDHDNYIGSLVQQNNIAATWSDFFVQNRLEPQFKMAVGSGRLNTSLSKSFARFCNQVESIFPKEEPSLLHGDLWSGNFMVNNEGNACIYDPAVYYGHREMDIGMSKLFGGFDKAFYLAYNQEYPMEKGWERRVEYCNLYPLLVHVNLFGGGYASSVSAILSRF